MVLSFSLRNLVCHYWLKYLTILVLCTSTTVNANDSSDDFYTSPLGIQKLVKVEQKLLTAAYEYVSALENRINKVKSYLADYKESVIPGMTTIPGHKLEDDESGITNGKVPNNLRLYSGEKELDELATKVSSHPLITYRLIRRFALELSEIERDINMNNERKFLREMEKLRKGMILPKSKDIAGAIEGIIRVQDSYNLNMTEFASGNFLGLETKSGLRAVDCYQIGIYAFQASIFTRAIEWLERAYYLVKEENDKTVNEQMVEYAFQQAIDMHNNVQKNEPQHVYVFNETFSMSNTSKEVGNRTKLKRSLENYGHELYQETESIMDLWNFATLCSGKALQPLNKTKDLKCFYLPWRTIPIYVEKVEILHQDPFVYQIYDVLNDMEIERLLEIAAPFMSRAKVQEKLKGEKELFVPSSIRTSTTYWIHEGKEPALAKIPARIESITGLDVLGEEAAEDLQISSYGIGGHYNPHFDTLFDSKPLHSYTAFESLVGDRFATFMFYLSTIERGGGTAFPRLGVLAQPIKGSAVYWHNLRDDGLRHPLTLHGGCPVLYGTKHVANKWIRSNSQMFRHKCSTRLKM